MSDNLDTLTDAQLSEVFHAPYCHSGVWGWRVDSEPAVADDGSGRRFVWAVPVEKISGGHGGTPRRSVFFIEDIIRAKRAEKGAAK